MSAPEYRTFREFYPFYLSEHSDRATRRLHFLGTTLVLALVVTSAATQFWWLIIAAVVQAYAFAWVGHFVFEKNRPATFKHPWYSFLGDWRMWFEMLTGKIPF
ncbi:MAG: DUF962 domain-containing protein [Pirellula sp.]|nr:DUF962 domain-containing protein [Pirellula sp.]